MKFALVVLALCLGVAFADPVCLPSVFTWVRSQQFAQFANNGTGGFDVTEEYFDNNLGNYRTKEVAYVGPNNTQVFFDMLIIGASRKMYVLEGVQGSGSVTCNVSSINPPSPQPCLLNNATIVGSFFIAGDVFVQIWAESFSEPSNNVTYQEISLTAEDNIPIASREYSPSQGASQELYFNYNLNLPSDAWTIPSICAQSAQVVEPMPKEALKKRFSHWLKF